MKSKFFSFLILFYYINTNGANTSPSGWFSKTAYTESLKPVSITEAPMTTIKTTPSTTMTPPPTYPTTTYPPSQTDNYLDNITIQDLLSSDIDASEKIEKKIINAVTEYSSNCRTYGEIPLSTTGFSFPKDSLTVDLSEENNAVFYNIRISELPQNDYKKQSYSTLIMGCDSSRMAKIEVKLPKNIAISADVKIIRSTNFSKGFQPISDVVDEGSISFKLLFNTLSKQFSIQPNTSANYEDDIVSKILYTKSEVSLNITTKFQMAVYNNLKTWFDQIELPIRQYLIEKLDAEFTRNGISIADICSKFLTSEKNLKKVNLPFLNSYFNNLYVIPNAKLETWKGVDLSAGPIIIDGLSSFSSIELVVLESQPSIPDGEDGRYFRTLPLSDHLEMNLTTVRIKTNDLKGKLDWSYNSKQKSFLFILEFIQFDVKKSKSFNYIMKHGDYEEEYDSDHNYYRQYYYPSGSYVRSSSRDSKIEINVILGNLQIKTSKSSFCESENEFVHFVLSEYLKTVITNALKDSLSKKLNETIFVGCV